MTIKLLFYCAGYPPRLVSHASFWQRAEVEEHTTHHVLCSYRGIGIGLDVGAIEDQDVVAVIEENDILHTTVRPKGEWVP